MAVKVRGKRPDRRLKQIAAALEGYAETHPKANIEIYRLNNVSVRIRIIDPRFKGMPRLQRETDLWPFLDKLPEDVEADVSMVLLLSPEEKRRSLANMEFDHPTPSRI